MEKQILKFARLLRQSGLKVSPGEVMECLRGLKYFGISDRSVFYRVLKASLVKSETDTALFDLAFRLFFLQEAERPPMLSSGAYTELISGVDGSGTGKAGMGAASRELFQGVRERNTETLVRMIERRLAHLEFQDEKVDELVHRVKVKMEWFMVENAFERAGEEGQKDYEILKGLEDYLRQSIEKLIVKKQGEEGIADLLNQENLKNKDLGALNEVQVKEMERRIERLAKKLASRFSYRLKPSKTGRVDMRKMLMQAARLGRTPETLNYHDKVMDKPSLAVLCDVSGSVAVYSSFLLQLVYAMARRFKDIRTFLFVDEVAEITPEFRSASVQDAVKKAMDGARCSRLGISNFGQVFEIFRKEYLTSLDKKTSLIVLGDAKNNWYLPCREELELISERVGRIIWLNPEPQERWNQDDSIIGTYAPHCSEVMECRNLEQLERAVRRIV